MRHTLISLLVAFAALAVSCGQQAPSVQRAAAVSTSSASSTPKASSGAVARAVAPDPRVGAVFLGGDSMHTCSGAVLHSAGGDLILTAAHCVTNGFDAFFVPGLTENAEPQDFWRIDAVYLDPRWVKDQDPMADFAVARVSRDGGGSLEAYAGGGFALGAAPKAGTDVMVTGYALGVGGEPIGCGARTSADNQGFPSLACKGMVDGTSGSPWVVNSAIAGLVGGLEGGGCEEDVSYSPPFDDAVTRLVHRAEEGGPADQAPTAIDDEC